MTTSEKVAYLKGLAEGYGLDKSSKEGKLLATIIDVLEDLALDMDDLNDEIDELNEGLDVVSDDLADVEAILFDDVDEDDEDEEEDEEDDDGVLYEVTCPSCGEAVTFDEDILEKGQILCPNCGEALEFDLGDLEEDDEEEDDD